METLYADTVDPSHLHVQTLHFPPGHYNVVIHLTIGGLKLIRVESHVTGSFHANFPNKCFVHVEEKGANCRSKAI